MPAPDAREREPVRQWISGSSGRYYHHPMVRPLTRPEHLPVEIATSTPTPTVVTDQPQTA